ncbi:MAG: dihydrolipoyl dehydrogenase [Fimbriimonadaceae bacterium]|nr:dihydrolipoyl dehydrogenase [Fimbriimonadaceae bacterium]
MPDYDLIVIGAGPGGYVAAIRGAQLGLSVAVVEQEKALGGTCLRVGCIPSKALLESSEQYEQARTRLAEHGVIVGEVALDLGALLQRKTKTVSILTKGIEGLFKKHGVTRLTGRGVLTAPGTVEVRGERETSSVTASHVLLATGSVPVSLPGVALDGDRIGTSTEALAYPTVPKHLIVIGAGYIGLELGSVWRRLGARVTVVEYLDRILPGTDGELAADALKLFRKQGLEFRLGAKVSGASVEGESCTVTTAGGEPLTGDRVLVAVGRRANTGDLGLETVGITVDERGRIPVDAHFRTNLPGHYAIGDVIPGPLLAHVAEEEGIACVEAIVTGYGHVNYATVPGVCYTHPEVAGVGQTEEQLTAAGTAYRRGVFPFLANGRARSLGETDGKVKILADAATDRLLGVHILGPRAGDLIAEAVVAMEYGATAEDLARSFHAHPTLAETLKEAALAVDGRAIHM